MSTRTVTSCFLAFAFAISAREASAQQEPPKARPAEVGPTRLFLAPTARSPRRGKGSFGLTEIAFPWGEVGLTDHVSVRILAVPPLEGLTSAGVVIEPKIRLYGGARVQAAVGVVQPFSAQGGSGGGIGYGVVTLGSADTGVTVGYGYAYGAAADSEGSRGVLFLGAEKALGRHMRLIAEAYVGGAALGLPDQTILGGFRFSSGHFSADLAAVVPFYETGSGMPGPLLTIGWAF